MTVGFATAERGDPVSGIAECNLGRWGGGPRLVALVGKTPKDPVVTVAGCGLSVDGWVEAYDGQRNWRASRADGSMGDGSDISCHGVDPIYDPLHGRIVCQVYSGGVSAFTTATGQWTWLTGTIEPLDSQRCMCHALWV